MKVYKDASQLARALVGEFTVEKDKAAIRSLRRQMHRARSLAAADFIRGGIGRRLFGGSRKKAAGVRLIINRARVRKVGNVFHAGLVLHGLAALVEQGGRTDRHVIRPKLAKRLVFPLDGRIVQTDQVNHPGSRIPAAPFARRSVERSGLAIVTDMDGELQRTADRVIG